MESNYNEYERIAASEEYKQFKKQKFTFIWPIVILFVLYYATLPILAAYAQEFMGTLVFGNITFGYLYGMAYYIVAWGLAFVYVVKAAGFDKKVSAILDKYLDKKGAS
ncbi:DUF485 domain-containing protein [Salicibibacter cibarius]|uniref:DUF485 domain-containing protein n=1 Tax=Salicibibacter cibarius TaxID=2743000 RepID=A0A7T6Z4I8_9BACI|nr:DUF485 domain-containing protein [Salicibibacter cibarius]QQK76860.1 DUF485 domain-containing protein [Salicibibacter cibarius]